MKMKTSLLCLTMLMFLASTASCSISGSIFDKNGNTPVNNAPSGPPQAGSAETKATPPEMLVAELYKQHDAKKSPFFQTKDRALVDKYFTKSLADLIWTDAQTQKATGELGAIDADPLYNSQDPQIKNFAVGKGDIKGETATVIATFTNDGAKYSIEFSMKLVAAVWKIDNILYGKDAGSLMQWLKDTYNATPPAKSNVSGEFEGKYTVGETTCTVKPVKMAFEVRWAKGSGVEMFFAEGDNTFMSNPDKGEPNNFVFDDENYNTGTFYRADGKSFSVKRAR